MVATAHCFAQNGLEKKIEKSRKQKKERRNRARKVRGAKKNSEWQWGGELHWAATVLHGSISGRHVHSCSLRHMHTEFC